MPVTHGKATAQSCPRVLLVDDEPNLADLFREIIADSIDCSLLIAGGVREARGILLRQPVDLLIADVNLPDGSGLSLLGELRRRHPEASALVISGSPTIDSAVAAFRLGAADFICKPFTGQQMVEHIRRALAARQRRMRQEHRMRKLREAVRQLNAARRIVNRKVDLLCNDLIGAYGELSRQLEAVRIQEGFRRFIENASGLEQLLCHTMDWLLRQVGYCNIGIWLTGADSGLQLGAYMKYTIPAESDLTESLQRNLLPLIIRRGFVRLGPEDVQSVLTPPELKYLAQQGILGVNSTYLGESLAVLLLFRDSRTPFSEEDASALKAISPHFALALARCIRAAENLAGDSAPPEENRPDPREDPADWWKHGQEPPF